MTYKIIIKERPVWINSQTFEPCSPFAQFAEIYVPYLVRVLELDKEFTAYAKQSLSGAALHSTLKSQSPYKDTTNSTFK